MSNNGEQQLKQVDALICQGLQEGDPWDQQRMLIRARQVLSDAARSITSSMGVEHYQQVGAEQIHPAKHGLYIDPLIAPDMFYTVPQRPVVLPASDSVEIPLDFNSKAGWLIGMRGTVLDQTVGAFAAGELEQATVGVKITINDGELLTTNTNGQAFIAFADLFSGAQQWCPILRWLSETDKLNVTYRNFQPAAPVGHSLTPSLTFAFRREIYPGVGRPLGPSMKG